MIYIRQLLTIELCVSCARMFCSGVLYIKANPEEECSGMGLAIKLDVSYGVVNICMWAYVCVCIYFSFADVECEIW